MELESVLRLHPDVVDAAVDSVRDDVDGDLPRALVVPRSPDIRLSDVISFVNGSYRTFLPTFYVCHMLGLEIYCSLVIHVRQVSPQSTLSAFLKRSNYQK